MSLRKLSSALLALVGCAAPQAKVAEASDPSYRPGQVWSYHTRAGEEASTLTVLRVEQTDSLGVIVHVAVEGLAIRNPSAPGGVIRRAQHLPFARAGIERSVVRHVRDVAVPAYEEGYQEWRRAFDGGKGGIFTITVAEAVALLEPRSGS